jgi:hypothetical protein
MPRAAKPPLPGPIEMESIQRALSAGQGGVDSGLLLQSILTNWGSIDAFGRDIYSEYQAAKPGSFVRQKILDLMTRLVIKVTDQEIAKPRKPEDMSDAELMAQARALLERASHE